MRNSWISSQFLQFYFSWNFFLFSLPSFSSLFDFSPSLSPFDLSLSLLELSFPVVSVSFPALEFFDRSPFDFCWLPVLKPNCIFTSCAVCLIWNCKQPNKLRIYKSRKECACSMFHIILFVELLSVCAFCVMIFIFRLSLLLLLLSLLMLSVIVVIRLTNRIDVVGFHSFICDSLCFNSIFVSFAHRSVWFIALSKWHKW